MDRRPPLPPFPFETAVEKVRKAENGWNTRDPTQVALAYSAGSIWRNRTEFLVGREALVAFLTREPRTRLPANQRDLGFP
jgi:nuclear transport factor 2 (NTF2) superfamily protein